MKKRVRAALFGSPAGYALYKIVMHQYYSVWKLAAVVNHYRIALLECLSRRQRDRRLHLGCGNVYLEGWVNIDYYIGRRKMDRWLDISIGLPYREGDVRAIFTSHVLEHFTIEDGVRVLRECHRVLTPGGCLRIAVPSLTIALQHFQRGDIDEFKEVKGKTVSRRFVSHILRYNTHPTMYDFEFLRELLDEIGFSRIEEKAYLDSGVFAAEEIGEMDKYEAETLFVECRK